MSQSFTDWESTLMHYGVPGMRKGVRRTIKLDLSKRSRIIQNPARSQNVGTPQADRKMADSLKKPEWAKSDNERGITREDRFKQAVKSTNPQDIIDARRKKLRNLGR